MASLVAVALLSVAAPALADKVYPSANDVATAKAAASTVAEQVAQLDAKLAALRDNVTALQVQAAAAGEAANGAELAYQQASAEATAAAERASAAQQQADAASLALSKYAAGVFQGGNSLGQLGVLLESGPQGILDQAAGLEQIGAQQSRMLSQAKSTSLVATTLQEAASQAQARAQSASASAKAAADAAQSSVAAAQAAAQTAQQQENDLTVKLAALQKTSVDLEKQRQAGLAAAAAARAEAAAKAQAQAEAAAAAAAAAAAEKARQQAAAAGSSGSTSSGSTSGSTGGSTGSTDSTGSTSGSGPAVHGGVDAVLAYARAQLGKPYVWAAAGPNSFDCSGLTMMAWRQAGVYLSHYTGSQWNQTAHVPLSELLPGDLVFYGYDTSSISHVGLYIGGGQMIEAPHTGDVVKISSIYRSNLLPYGGRP